MLDIKFVRDNPEAVKENIRKKFQNAKLPLVDEVIALDAEKRAAMNEANDLRAQRNQLSKRVGMLMGQAKRTQQAGGSRGGQGPGEGQRRPTGPVGGDGGPFDPADHQNHDGDPADD